MTLSSDLWRRDMVALFSAEGAGTLLPPPGAPEPGHVRDAMEAFPLTHPVTPPLAVVHGSTYLLLNPDDLAADRLRLSNLFAGKWNLKKKLSSEGGKWHAVRGLAAYGHRLYYNREGLGLRLLFYRNARGAVGVLCQGYRTQTPRLIAKDIDWIDRRLSELTRRKESLLFELSLLSDVSETDAPPLPSSPPTPPLFDDSDFFSR